MTTNFANQPSGVQKKRGRPQGQKNKPKYAKICSVRSGVSAAKEVAMELAAMACKLQAAMGSEGSATPGLNWLVENIKGAEVDSAWLLNYAIVHGPYQAELCAQSFRTDTDMAVEPMEKKMKKAMELIVAVPSADSASLEDIEKAIRRMIQKFKEVDVNTPTEGLCWLAELANTKEEKMSELVRRMYADVLQVACMGNIKNAEDVAAQFKEVAEGAQAGCSNAA
jgi:hypothetical protein